MNNMERVTNMEAIIVENGGTHGELVIDDLGERESD